MESQDLFYDIRIGPVATARELYELCDGLGGRAWLGIHLLLRPLLWREGHIILDEDMPARGKVVEGIVLVLSHDALVDLLHLRLCLGRQLHGEEVDDGVPSRISRNTALNSSNSLSTNKTSPSRSPPLFRALYNM